MLFLVVVEALIFTGAPPPERFSPLSSLLSEARSDCLATVTLFSAAIRNERSLLVL